MIIIINNKQMEIELGATVAQLLKTLNKNRSAVWVNKKQLLKAEYETVILKENDEVKILRTIAGG
ncbi:MAG: sulfur carrier protein ThiS [Anaerovoracaceae bacterium]